MCILAKNEKGEIMLANFRDIGGIPVEAGNFKSGYFYRSGQLTDLSEQDIRSLKKDYKIKKIYDFRSAQEIEEQPDTEIDGIEKENIDILQSVASINMAALNNMQGIDSKNVKNAMIETYSSLITSESAIEGYKQFLEGILDKNTPLVFHCFAGKDRTGIAAAIILKIAGATDEQIMNDYLKTNSSRVSINREILSTFKSTLTKDQLKALNIALLVDKSYLIHAQEVLNKTYGSFEGYLFEGLKVQKDYIDTFREKFVIRK
ncbi:tyrosine-protein phosphatase [Enterococcus sp. AZ163]|uniref:tyrosine-protein phosphatase n=2 Tax=Enterococcus TaxID=1350 RepID=UPI003D28B16F